MAKKTRLDARIRGKRQRAIVPIGGVGGTTPNATAAEPAHDAIAKRAFEIYISRGAEHGRDVDDWTQAQRELGACGT